MSKATEKNIKENIESSYNSLCYTILEMMKLEKELKGNSADNVRSMYQKLFELNQELKYIRKDFQKLFGNIAEIN